MEGNYIIVGLDGTAHICISMKTKNTLETLEPQGCPWFDYSLFDLLKDWIGMYSWQIERNKKIPLSDFVKQIRTDGKEIYKNAMIALLR